MVPVVPVYAATPLNVALVRKGLPPVPDHRPEPDQPTWLRVLVLLMVGVAFVVIAWLFVGAMHEPVGDPAHGVVTIPAPARTGGVPQ